MCTVHCYSLLRVLRVTFIVLLSGVLPGLQNAHALPSIWEAESGAFVGKTGSDPDVGQSGYVQEFSCSQCHDAEEAPSLRMSLPASIPHDATTADITLSGFNSGTLLSSWRYQTEGTTLLPTVNGVRPSPATGSTEKTVQFKLTDSPVIIRYCLVDVDSTETRRWNCERRVIPRDAPPNEPPRITSVIPSDQSADLGSDAFEFMVTATDSESVPVVSVSSEDSSVVTVAGSSGSGYLLDFVGVGTAAIEIKVVDSVGAQITSSFDVTVTKAPVTVPPVIPPITPPVIPPVIPPITPPVIPPVIPPITPPVIPPVIPPITPPVIPEPNSPPVAMADIYIVREQNAEVSLSVLDNDSDADGHDIVVLLSELLSLQGRSLKAVDGVIIYSVKEPLTEDDSFSYRIEDTQGAQSGTVRVTLSPSDSDGDLVVDALDNCPVLANPDQADMDTDQLGDLCDIDPDGDGLPGISGTDFDSGRVLVESECLTCHLTGVSGAPLFTDEASWESRITAAGGEPEDLLGSVQSGLGAMPAFGSTYSSRELLQAIYYLSGREAAEPPPPGSVVDSDLDGIDDSVDNCLMVPNSDQIDSDNNKIGDVCEPLADRDGDGFPFSLDDDDGNARRLLAALPVVVGVSNSTVFTGEGDIGLGRVARTAAEARNFSSASLFVLEPEFSQLASSLFLSQPVIKDSRFSSLMGTLNLEATTFGGEATLVVQLGSNIPLNAALRVLDTGTGTWGDFNTDSTDQLSSAPVVAGGCPVSGSPNYKAGLNAGNACLRILVSDGGQNDADGQVDGRAELIGNVASEVLDTIATPTTVESPNNKSGGATGIWLFMLMAVFAVSRGVFTLERRL